MFAPWPKPLDETFRSFYGLTDQQFQSAEAKYELVSQGRNLRREINLPANKKAKFIYKPLQPVAAQDAAVLKILLNAEALDIDPNFQAPKGMAVSHAKLGEIFLPTEGLVDVSAEKTRLGKELEKVAGEIAKIEQKLSNTVFVQKAPPHVLQEWQKRLAEWQAKHQQIQKALQGLTG